MLPWSLKTANVVGWTDGDAMTRLNGEEDASSRAPFGLVYIIIEVAKYFFFHVSVIIVINKVVVVGDVIVVVMVVVVVVAWA